jgi:hypothetical protein
LPPRSAAIARGVERARGEVVAAEALDRDDRAAAQEIRGARDRIAGLGLALARLEHEARAACGAAHGLRVEAAVTRIGVLARRTRAHIANPPIVVAARSYGTPVTIVKRGPQFVQFVNA